MANRKSLVPMQAPAPTASATSLNLPHGTAPSSPANGDVWTTSSGLFVRINGVTYGPLGEVMLPFFQSGTLTTGTGKGRIYLERAGVITGVRASVGTAPTGASIICDLNKNGTTIFSTQANRPTIAASGFTSGRVTTMDVTSVAAGDYLTLDIDQIGSTVAGADLSVTVTVLT